MGANARILVALLMKFNSFKYGLKLYFSIDLIKNYKMNVEVWIFAKFNQNIRMFSKIYFCLLFNKVWFKSTKKNQKYNLTNALKHLFNKFGWASIFV